MISQKTILIVFVVIALLIVFMAIDSKKKDEKRKAEEAAKPPDNSKPSGSDGEWYDPAIQYSMYGAMWLGETVSDGWDDFTDWAGI